MMFLLMCVADSPSVSLGVFGVSGGARMPVMFSLRFCVSRCVDMIPSQQLSRLY